MCVCVCVCVCVCINCEILFEPFAVHNHKPNGFSIMVKLFKASGGANRISVQINTNKILISEREWMIISEKRREKKKKKKNFHVDSGQTTKILQ